MAGATRNLTPDDWRAMTRAKPKVPTDESGLLSGLVATYLVLYVQSLDRSRAIYEDSVCGRSTPTMDRKYATGGVTLWPRDECPTGSILPTQSKTRPISYSSSPLLGSTNGFARLPEEAVRRRPILRSRT
jgi:hypothetical protein